MEKYRSVSSLVASRSRISCIVPGSSATGVNQLDSISPPQRAGDQGYLRRRQPPDAHEIGCLHAAELVHSSDDMSVDDDDNGIGRLIRDRGSSPDREVARPKSPDDIVKVRRPRLLQLLGRDD